MSTTTSGLDLVHPLTGGAPILDVATPLVIRSSRGSATPESQTLAGGPAYDARREAPLIIDSSLLNPSRIKNKQTMKIRAPVPEATERISAVLSDRSWPATLNLQRASRWRGS
jgi:hypothetical protein